MSKYVVVFPSDDSTHVLSLTEQQAKNLLKAVVLNHFGLIDSPTVFDINKGEFLELES